MPQAITCALEAADADGDSDTIGGITGGIAEAFYGIPKDLYDPRNGIS